MRKLAIIATLAFLAGSLPTEATGQTQTSVGARIGVDAGDIEEPFVGADVRVRLPTSPITINPTFDYYFTDDPVTFWSLSANGLYRFGTQNQVFTPYSGVGLQHRVRGEVSRQVRAENLCVLGDHQRGGVQRSG